MYYSMITRKLTVREQQLVAFVLDIIEDKLSENEQALSDGRDDVPNESVVLLQRDRLPYIKNSKLHLKGTDEVDEFGYQLCVLLKQGVQQDEFLTAGQRRGQVAIINRLEKLLIIYCEQCNHTPYWKQFMI